MVLRGLAGHAARTGAARWERVRAAMVFRFRRHAAAPAAQITRTEMLFPWAKISRGHMPYTVRIEWLKCVESG